MIRLDLEASGIPYRDLSGKVFDFHSLRCQLATLADAAGVSPRVVQNMMRHSKLEMTGRYTRPRAVDIEAAASRIPSLAPGEHRPEAVAMTGTDAAVVPPSLATQDATPEDAYARKSNEDLGVVSMQGRYVNPLVVGSSPTPVT